MIQEMFNEAPLYRCENCRAPLATEEKFERKYFICCVCKHKLVLNEYLSFKIFFVNLLLHVSL